MVFGELLPYWEGAFSGAMLKFGGVFFKSPCASKSESEGRAHTLPYITMPGMHPLSMSTRLERGNFLAIQMYPNCMHDVSKKTSYK